MHFIKNNQACIQTIKIFITCKRFKSAAVKKIEHNPVTGSVLIEYEPSKVPMEKLLPMQDFFTNLANQAQHFDGSQAQKNKLSQMISTLEGIF